MSRNLYSGRAVASSPRRGAYFYESTPCDQDKKEAERGRSCPTMDGLT
jgi:hypothetical protein